jgi:predicted transcriptional regulator
MKETSQYSLNKEDAKIINLFSELGMPKNLAKTLVYISRVPDCRSDDIESGTKLRQPEVSIAVRELSRRGWTNTREQKKKGKGRPIHIYKLSTNLTNVVKTFEQEKIIQIKQIQDNLNELEKIIK